MECDQCFPSQPFVVLTVEQFVGQGGGPLERQKQDGHSFQTEISSLVVFVLYYYKKLTPFDSTEVF